MPRKSQGEKDKEKKEADQQRQVTSYFKTVSVAGDKPSNVNLLKRPRDNPSGGSPSEENHYQNKKNKKNKRKKHQEDEKKKKENKRGQDTAGSLIIEVAEDSIHSTQSSESDSSSDSRESRPSQSQRSQVRARKTVSLQSISTPALSSSASSSSLARDTCPICLLPIAEGKLITLPCGCKYDETCMAGWFKQKPQCIQRHHNGEKDGKQLSYSSAGKMYVVVPCPEPSPSPDSSETSVAMADGAMAKTVQELRVGSKAFAFYVPGTILAIQSNGKTFTIQHEDGNIIEQVPAHAIMTKALLDSGKLAFSEWLDKTRIVKPLAPKPTEKTVGTVVKNVKFRTKWVEEIKEAVENENVKRMLSGWPQESLIAHTFAWQPLLGRSAELAIGSRFVLSGLNDRALNDKQATICERSADGSVVVEISDEEGLLKRLAVSAHQLRVTGSITQMGHAEILLPTCTCCGKQWQGDLRIVNVKKHFCESGQHWKAQNVAARSAAYTSCGVHRMTQLSDS